MPIQNLKKLVSGTLKVAHKEETGGIFPVGNPPMIGGDQEINLVNSFVFSGDLKIRELEFLFINEHNNIFEARIGLEDGTVIERRFFQNYVFRLDNRFSPITKVYIRAISHDKLSHKNTDMVINYTSIL